MKILSDRYTVNGYNGEWRLDVYSDTHFATESVDEDKLKADIADTKATGRPWVHLGDVIDGIIPGDRRWNENYKRSLAPWAWKAHQESRLIEAEWERFAELFSPIASQGVVVLSGDGKHNEMGDIADCFHNTISDWGVEGGFPACFYEITFNRGGSTSRRTVHLMLHHGYFAGRTNSNKVVNLERALNQFPDTHAFICGHGHNKVATRIDALIVEGKKITQRVRRGAMTGSYLKTYAQDVCGYGEIKGYPASGLGKITLVLRPFHHDQEKRVEFENM